MADAEKRKRCGNISQEQKDVLISFVASNEKLRNKKFDASFTYQHSQNLWKDITKELNAIPNGSPKTWDKWRKSWQDLRCNVKSKVAKEKKHATGTGGGNKLQLLNNSDTAVLNLLSQVTVEGDPQVEEGDVSFSFGHSVEYLEDDADFDESLGPTIQNQAIIRNDSNELAVVEPPTVGNARLSATNSVGSRETPPKSSTSNRTRIYKKDERFAETKNFTSKIANTGEQDLNLRSDYYTAKLKLLERQVAAYETIANICSNAFVILEKFATAWLPSNMEVQHDDEDLIFEDIEGFD
ncbi:uncharacterized protein LOC127280405 [Leptopilina boulardi]|uniref:uncharacterized protein LOC127280405 n=1 Tax=Leptopilina boulardi TaxID=63433 RepID=UPI0021F5A72A|nr:uncharacterized protein LOC127280405 [Leptopilina boulardi]